MPPENPGPGVERLPVVGGSGKLWRSERMGRDLVEVVVQKKKGFRHGWGIKKLRRLWMARNWKRRDLGLFPAGVGGPRIGWPIGGRWVLPVFQGAGNGKNRGRGGDSSRGVGKGPSPLAGLDPNLGLDGGLGASVQWAWTRDRKKKRDFGIPPAVPRLRLALRAD